MLNVPDEPLTEEARRTVRIHEGIDGYATQPLYFREGEIAITTVAECGAFDSRTRSVSL